MLSLWMILNIVFWIFVRIFLSIKRFLIKVYTQKEPISINPEETSIYKEDKRLDSKVRKIDRSRFYSIIEYIIKIPNFIIYHMEVLKYILILLYDFKHYSHFSSLR